MPSYLNKRNKRIYEMKTIEGLSHEQISEAMKISVPRVSQILSQEYKKNQHLKSTDKAKADVAEIIRMYNGSIHPKVIADKYGVSDRFIRILLEKQGVYRKKLKPFPKSVDHTAFSSYGPEAMYFMGVFHQFGFFGQNFIVGISHKNKEIIEMIANIITPSGQTKHKYHFSNDSYKLTFISKSIYNFLHSNGFTENSMRPENGIVLSSLDFWRGVVDSCGDLGLANNGLPYMSIKTNDEYTKNAFIMFLRNNVELGFDVKEGTWLLTLTLMTNLPVIVKDMFINAPKELRLSRNYERALMVTESSKL